MGLFDFGATVLTKYKADTTDHKRKVRQLRNEEKKAAKARLEEIEQHNSKLEGQIATLGKVAAGVAALGAAYIAARASFDEYAKRSQLQSAATGVNIDALRTKSRGLLTDMQLLELAAQAQNSAFGATQDELETLAEAYTVLVSRGNDGAKSFEELKKAAVEANTEGLKQLGVQIKAQSDTIEGHTALYRGLRGEVEKTGKQYAISGESIMQATVDIDNSMSELKSSLGELVKELAPAISGLAKLIGLMAQAVAPIAGAFVLSEEEKAQARGGAIPQRRKGETAHHYHMRMLGIASGDGALATQARSAGNLGHIQGAMAATQEAALSGTRGAIASRIAAQQTKLLEVIAKASTITAGKGSGKKFSAKGLPSGIPGMAADQGSDDEGLFQLMEGAIDMSQGADDVERLRDTLKEITTWDLDQEEPLLQKVFGDIDEFAPLLEAGLQTISTALNGAYSAWASGAMSAADAVRKALADTIAGIGNEMFVRSLAAFASGNFTSGALYAAGAVTAGVIARKMDSSASVETRGPAPSGGGLSPAFAGAGQGGGRSVTVYVGSDFGAGDRRQEQQKLKRTLNDIGMGTDGQVVFA